MNISRKYLSIIFILIIIWSCNNQENLEESKSRLKSELESVESTNKIDSAKNNSKFAIIKYDSISLFDTINGSLLEVTEKNSVTIIVNDQHDSWTKITKYTRDSSYNDISIEGWLKDTDLIFVDSIDTKYNSLHKILEELYWGRGYKLFVWNFNHFFNNYYSIIYLLSGGFEGIKGTNVYQVETNNAIRRVSAMSEYKTDTVQNYIILFNKQRIEVFDTTLLEYEEHLLYKNIQSLSCRIVKTNENKIKVENSFFEYDTVENILVHFFKSSEELLQDSLIYEFENGFNIITE